MSFLLRKYRLRKLVKAKRKALVRLMDETDKFLIESNKSDVGAELKKIEGLKKTMDQIKAEYNEALDQLIDSK